MNGKPDIHPLALRDLADKINDAHSCCESAARSALGCAMEAGRLLCEAKAIVPHGQWATWLASHCKVSDRTARMYMQLYRRRAELKRQRAADLPVRQAAKLLTRPKDAGDSEPAPARPIKPFDDLQLIDTIRQSIWTIWQRTPKRWKPVVIPKYRGLLKELEETGDLGW